MQNTRITCRTSGCNNFGSPVKGNLCNSCHKKESERCLIKDCQHFGNKDTNGLCNKCSKYYKFCRKCKKFAKQLPENLASPLCACENNSLSKSSVEQCKSRDCQNIGTDEQLGLCSSCCVRFGFCRVCHGFSKNVPDWLINGYSCLCEQKNTVNKTPVNNKDQPLPTENPANHCKNQNCVRYGHEENSGLCHQCADLYGFCRKCQGFSINVPENIFNGLWCSCVNNKNLNRNNSLLSTSDPDELMQTQVNEDADKSMRLEYPEFEKCSEDGCYRQGRVSMGGRCPTCFSMFACISKNTSEDSTGLYQCTTPSCDKPVSKECGKKCIVDGCLFFGSSNFQDKCSQCYNRLKTFRLLKAESLPSLFFSDDHIHLRCLTPNCKFYGNPKQSNLCSTCYNRKLTWPSELPVTSRQCPRYTHAQSVPYGPISPETTPTHSSASGESITYMNNPCKRKCGKLCRTDTFPYCWDCFDHFKRMTLDVNPTLPELSEIDVNTSNQRMSTLDVNPILPHRQSDVNTLNQRMLTLDVNPISQTDYQSYNPYVTNDQTTTAMLSERNEPDLAFNPRLKKLCRETEERNSISSTDLFPESFEDVLFSNLPNLSSEAVPLSTLPSEPIPYTSVPSKPLHHEMPSEQVSSSKLPTQPVPPLQVPLDQMAGNEKEQDVPSSVQDSNANEVKPDYKVKLSIVSEAVSNLEADDIICLWSKQMMDSGPSHPILQHTGPSGHDVLGPWTTFKKVVQSDKVMETSAGSLQIKRMLHCLCDKTSARGLADSLWKGIDVAKNSSVVIVPFIHCDLMYNNLDSSVRACLKLVNDLEKCKLTHSLKQVIIAVGNTNIEDRFNKVIKKLLPYSRTEDEKHVCRSCNMRPRVKLRTLSRHCDEDCCWFCVDCLQQSQKKPLDCQLHGPCLSPIGHENMFALLIAGQDDRENAAQIFIQDTIDIAETLRNPDIIGIRNENLQVITTPKPGSRYGDMKTRVIEAFRDLRSRMERKEHTCFFLYFSGHNSHESLRLGSSTDRITPKELRKELQALDADNIIIMLDCCYSAGAQLFTYNEDDFMRSLGEIENTESGSFVLLPKLWNLHDDDDPPAGAKNVTRVKQWASSVASEKSFFVYESKRSMFTYCIRKLLHGHCPASLGETCSYCVKYHDTAKEDECIYLKNLHVCVKEHVEVLASDLNAEQHPQLSGSDDGDIALAFHLHIQT